MQYAIDTLDKADAVGVCVTMAGELKSAGRSQTNVRLRERKCELLWINVRFIYRWLIALGLIASGASCARANVCWLAIVPHQETGIDAVLHVDWVAPVLWVISIF